MLIPITANLAFRRQPTPIALPDTWLRLFAKPDDGGESAAEIIGIETGPTGTPIGFSLRRRKEGAEIWLHFSNRFRMNLSGQVGTPRTFREARKLMSSWSNDHGAPFHELNPYA